MVDSTARAARVGAAAHRALLRRARRGHPRRARAGAGAGAARRAAPQLLHPGIAVRRPHHRRARPVTCAREAGREGAASRPPTPTCRATSSSTSAASTPGTRRTSRSSATRATRSTASTCAAARATCGSSSTARLLAESARAPPALRDRPAARASTSLARTSSLDLLPERDADLLRVQGRGVLLVAGATPRHRLDLRRPAARRRAGRGPDRVLGRARRRLRRRPAAGAAAHRGLAGDHGRGRDQRRIGSSRWRPATCRRPSPRLRRRTASRSSQGFDWLCEQGHVGLERVAKARRDPSIVAPVRAALAVLATIHDRLQGDISVLQASRENLLSPVDLVHARSGTLIELDGPEHLTSFRLTALDLYPADARIGFDIDEYRALCRALARRSDGVARGLPAKGFGFGGRAARARLPGRAARSRDAGHGPSAAPAGRGPRTATGRPRTGAGGARCSGSSAARILDSSTSTTLTVLQRPH